MEARLTEEAAHYEFDQLFQRKIAALYLRDSKFAQKARDLVRPEYFSENAAGVLVRIAQNHQKTYKTIPDFRILPTIIKDEIAARRIRPDMIEPVNKMIKEVMNFDLSNPGFVRDQITDFAKHQAIEKAMFDALPLLEKRDWDKIGTIFDEARRVGVITDSEDYDYWKEITSRTQKREDFKAGKIVRDGITTGYSGIDAYLYHGGWGRKELSCIMGPAKSGKSLSLGDFTKNAAIAGHNTFYGSCEVACSIISDRLDAAISDTLIRELHKDPAAVEAAITKIGAGSGALKMREFPSGQLKPSQLHRVLEEYRNDGIVFDLVTVDYADILASEYRSDSLQENLRTIYIDLRALAFEMNAAFLTATQTNRAGATATTAKATDVGDDFNKVRTVDVLIGINATDAEKKSNEARLFWAASRNTEDGFTLRIRQDRQKMKFLTKILGRE